MRRRRKEGRRRREGDRGKSYNLHTDGRELWNNQSPKNVKAIYSIDSDHAMLCIPYALRRLLVLICDRFLDIALQYCFN